MRIILLHIKLKSKNYFILTTVLINFSIFFYSGIDKLLNFDFFLTQFGRSPFAPSLFLKEISFAIILLELFLCLLLFFPKHLKNALLGFFILSSIFSIYITLMILYSPQLPCSCGGLVNFLNWEEHLILNIYLTLSSLISFSLLDSI